MLRWTLTGVEFDAHRSWLHRTQLGRGFVENDVNTRNYSATLQTTSDALQKYGPARLLLRSDTRLKTTLTPKREQNWAPHISHSIPQLTHALPLPQKYRKHPQPSTTFGAYTFALIAVLMSLFDRPRKRWIYSQLWHL